jgi:hypothetical protein
MAMFSALPAVPGDRASLAPFAGCVEWLRSAQLATSGILLSLTGVDSRNALREAFVSLAC